MKWTTVVALAIVAGLIWWLHRQGIFAGIFGRPVLPSDAYAPPTGGIQGGSTFGRACNQVYQQAGQVAGAAPDPRVALAGQGAQALGPLACSLFEEGGKLIGKGAKAVGKGAVAAGKAVGKGAVAVGKGTVSSVKAAGGVAASAGKTIVKHHPVTYAAKGAKAVGGKVGGAIRSIF